MKYPGKHLRTMFSNSISYSIDWCMPYLMSTKIEEEVYEPGHLLVYINYYRTVMDDLTQ